MMILIYLLVKGVNFSTAAPSPAQAQVNQNIRVYGGLKDQDRIFTNLYGEQDWGIQGAIKRVLHILYPPVKFTVYTTTCGRGGEGRGDASHLVHMSIIVL